MCQPASAQLSRENGPFSIMHDRGVPVSPDLLGIKQVFILQCELQYSATCSTWMQCVIAHHAAALVTSMN